MRKNIICIIFAIIIFGSFLSAAQASEWIEIHKGANALIYIDGSSLVRRGNKINVWVKYINRSVHSQKNIKRSVACRVSYIEFEIGQPLRGKILSQNTYDKNGAVIDSLEDIFPKAHIVFPDSTEELIYKQCMNLLNLTAYSKANVIVYITRSGHHYHCKNCEWLSKSKIKIQLHDALHRGYTPCSVCNPPDM